jgi:hypothetical protein
MELEEIPNPSIVQEGKELHLALPKGTCEGCIDDSPDSDSAWEAFDELRLSSATARGAACPGAVSSGGASLYSDTLADISTFDAFPDDCPPHGQPKTPDRVFDYDDRIRVELRPFVCVGRHGGLVLTPHAVVDADAADPRLVEAYRLVVEHCLCSDAQRGTTSLLPLDNVATIESDVQVGSGIHTPTSSTEALSDEKGLVLSAHDVTQENHLNLELLDIEGCASENSADDTNEGAVTASAEENGSESAVDSESTKHRDLPQRFRWMDSESRQIILKFGSLVRAQRADREIAERRDSEAALATAQAASERTAQNDYQGAKEKAPAQPSLEDANAWMSQQRFVISETFRTVRHTVQKRSRRGSGGASGGNVDHDDSGMWGFLLPRNTKLKPEAAAEMARARVAAAAAAKAMLGDASDTPHGQGDHAASNNSASRDGHHLRSRQRPMSEPPLHGAKLDARPEGADLDGKSTVRVSLPFIDDATMLWRAQMQNVPHDSSLDSPTSNPGFPRALSENFARQVGLKAPSKKKRVSFGVSTVCHD